MNYSAYNETQYVSNRYINNIRLWSSVILEHDKNNIIPKQVNICVVANLVVDNLVVDNYFIILIKLNSNKNQRNHN